MDLSTKLADYFSRFVTEIENLLESNSALTVNLLSICRQFMQLLFSVINFFQSAGKAFSRLCHISDSNLLTMSNNINSVQSIIYCLSAIKNW